MVIRRFNRFSPTGAGRSVGNPNLRTMDYMRKPLLCSKCDQRFSRLGEDHYARTIEKEYAETGRVSEQVCTEELRYFGASVIWRILVWGLESDDDNGLTVADDARCKRAEAALRAYLLDEGPCPEFPVVWLHLFVAPYLTNAPASVNELLHASLVPTVQGVGDNLYVIAGMGSVFIVGVLQLEGDNLMGWTFFTEFRPGQKLIPLPTNRYAVLDDRFWQVIEHFAQRCAALKSANPPSKRQQAEIQRRVEDVPKEALQRSPHVIAIATDSSSRSAKIPRSSKDGV